MNCLCCGKIIKETDASDHGWHISCIRRFFNTKELPQIDVSKEQLEILANDAVRHGLTVPGVQKTVQSHRPR